MWKRFHYPSHKEKISFEKHKEKYEKCAKGFWSTNFFLTKENAVSTLPLGARDSFVPWGYTFHQNTTLLYSSLIKWNPSLNQTQNDGFLQNIPLFNQTWQSFAGGWTIESTNGEEISSFKESCQTGLKIEEGKEMLKIISTVH